MGVAPYTDPKYSDRFRANAFFIGNSMRDAVGQVRADYTPIFFSQIPEMFRSGRLPIDVALIMVSPPDQYGFCSLGVSVDMTRPAALSAKLLVAQVNRTCRARWATASFTSATSTTWSRMTSRC